MVKLLAVVAVLFALALGLHWLKATPGEVAVTVGDTAYAVDLTTATVALAATIVAALVLLLVVRAITRAPRRVSRGFRKRNAERGRTALSEGLVAVAAGDLRRAEHAALEASRRSPDQPLTRLLQAQTAQLRGDRAAARRVFQAMTEDPRTRIAGLRGLYVEAEREGEREAAHLIAERARAESPATAWAARELLRHQAAAADWDGALRTISGATDSRIIDKRAARRQRAVMLTALALDREDGDPDRARAAALEAHELAHDLVPAAVAAGRLLSRQGDIRRAARVLETAWKAAPHPEIADAYTHVRSGNSAGDRLKRAEGLFRLRSEADEGRLAVARAAIEARDFARARAVIAPVLTTRPTQKALVLMAELEEAESGDRGRAREWLARAVRAPRDAVWVADGVILNAWAPASPVTGRIDAVEWKMPVAELQAPRLEIDAAELEPPTLPEPAPAVRPADIPGEATVAASPHPAVLQATAPLAAAAPPSPAIGDPLDAAPKTVASAGRTNGSTAADAPEESTRRDAPGELPPGETMVALPPPPDDPGVADDDRPDEDGRRFRLF